VLGVKDTFLAVEFVYVGWRGTKSRRRADMSGGPDRTKSRDHGPFAQPVDKRQHIGGILSRAP
jgi:hypothetical protein